MSCDKVKLFKLESSKDLLKIFYPNLTNDNQNENQNENEFELIKKRFFKEAFFDLSIISKLIAFVKDNQIVLIGFEPNYECNLFNKNLKPLKDKKQLRLNVNEIITSVKILPFYSNKSSTIYTFILIGFENGTIKIFNESLICLFEFKFNSTPVFDFKLFSSTNELNSEQLNQTIFIQYDEFCVKIDGLQLISILGQNENKLQLDQPLINNLFYEIWYLKRNFNDFVYCGLVYESIYDNLIQQSLFNQDTYFKLKDQRTIKRDLLISVGNDQYLNFYDLNKNESEITIKDAMSSLVSKIIWGNKTQDDPKFTTNNASLFFNLNKHSSGNQIVMSSNCGLALIYDQMNDDSKNGTISLLDLKRKELIRTWRNYYNCQFSFIEVNNLMNKGPERALFLCFYLPDLNKIEIWPSRYDDKIVDLEVGNNCILLNNQTVFKAKQISTSSTTSNKQIPSTILFDFNTFTCYTFDISFLCAVNDYKINSRDDLLLKEIPRTINNSKFKKEDLESIIKKLTSSENKLIILKMMFEKNDLDLIDYTVNSFKQLSITDNNTDNELNRSLLINLEFVNKLCSIYEFLNEKNKNLNDFMIKKNILTDIPNNISEEADHLKWKETDLTRIMPLFIFSEHLNPNDLVFRLPNLTIQEFMNYFNLELDEQMNSLTKCNCNLKQENLHKLSTNLFSYLILVEQDLKIIDFYLQNSLSALDLIYLLFNAWSTNEFTFNWKTWKVLLLIAFYLVDGYKKECKNELIFKRNLISCLKQACKLFLASTFIQSSIVGTYTIQVIYNLFCKKDKQTNLEYYTNEDDEWVEISLDEESFSSVLKQLEDIYLLNLLLKCGNSEPDLQISLITLVKSKNSLTGELVAQHCVRNLMNANVIAQLDNLEEEKEDEQEDEQIKSNFKTEVDKTLRMLNDTDEDLFGQLLKHVQLRFPCNLNTSVLLAHCAWQSILKFIQNPSINYLVHLQQCLNYLDRIKDPILKHKISLLIWKAFLTEKLFKINKIIYDDKNWSFTNFQNDLGLEESILESFVTFLNDFIEFIFNTINDANSFTTQIEYKKDDWWMPKKNKIIIEDKEKSIIQMALNLKVAKHNITLLHSHLALITSLTINFKENTITSLKSCFPQALTSLLYTDLNIDVNLDDDNEHLRKCRERIIKKFTQNIALNVPTVTNRSPNEREKECFREANSWISKLIDLAVDWNIDSRLVKTNYVFCLYLNGCDVLAKEELYSINDEDFIGRMFMQLIPARLITLYGNQIYKKISLFPSEIINEIQRNPNQRVEFEVTFESIRQFIECCISKLNDNSFYFRTATCVLQVIIQK